MLPRQMLPSSSKGKGVVFMAIVAAAVQILLLRAAVGLYSASTISDAPDLDGGCLVRLRPLLTYEEKEKELDILFCTSNPKLASVVIQDRTEMNKLKRKEYLHSLRSYRLSGLICNDHLDKDIPPIVSEAAFKCLTDDYKRRACMDGRVSIPGTCSAYKRSDVSEPYIPLPERVQLEQALIKAEIYAKECDAKTAAEGVAKCRETMVGPNGGGVVSNRQLSAGIAEAEVLTLAKGSIAVWRTQTIDAHLSLIEQGKDISPLDYPGSHAALQRAIEVVDVKDKSVAVFGSISPWVESILHHNGVRSPTMTVDYNQPISLDKRMTTEMMGVMLEGDSQFDVIVSYSSIEHDGQGRYGDPLDPDGDLAAMKECWLKVAPGGFFILHIPFSGDANDQFWWYSQRTYGASRIGLLIRGWQYLGLATKTELYGAKDEFSIKEVAGGSPVLILRKPPTVDANAVLDTTKFGGLNCDFKSKKCNPEINIVGTAIPIMS